MELFCFVILHYKDLEVTDRCVRSILAMENQEQIRIVVVDNDIKEKASKRAVLQKRYEAVPNIYVIQIKENGGFSHANNAGYLFAKQELRASYILALNNDIEFTQKDFTQRLQNAYQTNPCHILGPDIIRCGGGEHQNPLDTRLRTKKEAEYTIRMNRFALRCYPLFYPLLYLQNRRVEKMRLRQNQANHAFYESVQKDIVPFGACLIYTPDFVHQEDRAFEPETQFYYEEYILTLRCRKKNYRIVYDPSLRVMHESGKATKSSFGNEWKRLRFVMERTAEACGIYLDYYKSKKM